MKQVVGGLFVILIFVAAGAAWHHSTLPVTLTFPDFPDGVAIVDLGQNLTIKVITTNDGGKGVTWTCAGDACGKMTTTTKWATFYASGITGTATIAATSIKRPSVSTSIKVTAHLNATPTMLCDGGFLRRELGARVAIGDDLERALKSRSARVLQQLVQVNPAVLQLRFVRCQTDFPRPGAVMKLPEVRDVRVRCDRLA